MPNVATIVRCHNRQVRQGMPGTDNSQDRRCNCRKLEQCPLKGACLTTGLIYKASVQSETTAAPKEYIGLTEYTFKQRYSNHMCDLRLEHRENSTELSKYVWQLKHSDEEFNIDWTICRRAQPYSNITKRCNLCLMEKVHLIDADKSVSLNKRLELVSKC